MTEELALPGVLPGVVRRAVAGAEAVEVRILRGRLVGGQLDGGGSGGGMGEDGEETERGGVE